MALLCALLGLAGCVRAGYQQAARPDSGDGGVQDSAAHDAATVDTSPVDGPAVDGPAVDALAIDGPGSDGSLDAVEDASAADGPAPGVCSWTVPFSLTAPTNIQVLNSTVQDANPYVTPNGQTIYFSSKRSGGQGKEDIWVATRGVNGNWSPPTPYVELNSPLSESAFTLSADGQLGFLSSDRAGGKGNMDIWQVPRSTLTGRFALSNAIPLATVNDAEAQFDPMPAKNGLELYLSSNNFPAALGGQGAGDIVFAVRSSLGDPFSAPTPVGGINSASYEANPSLTADRRLILFASARPGGSGGGDIWYATRATASDPFSLPRTAPVINSPDFDAEPFVTRNGCEVYFVSSRAGGLGNWDIYHSSYVAAP